METRTYIALGSNLGDTAANLEAAIERLAQLATGKVLRSSFVRTEPFDMEDDAGDFLNAAVGFDTRLGARALLVALQEIEVDMGRPADHGHHTSRIIDLDIICYGDCVIDEPGLVVPHPRALERPFVIVPLAEIAPNLILPGCTLTLAALARQA